MFSPEQKEIIDKLLELHKEYIENRTLASTTETHQEFWGKKTESSFAEYNEYRAKVM